MNNLPAEQNEQKQLERLSAQRELYSAAKRLYSGQIVGNVLIPIILAIIAFCKFKLTAISASFGIIMFLVDLLFLVPAISRKKAKAAKIQELFDCDVLKIPKSPLKTAKDITVEEVLSSYEAHSKVKSNVERVRDWYSAELGKVNIALARLICQRTNCWWDKKMRSQYINALRAISIFVPIVLIIIGVACDMKLVEVILMVSGLMPLFRFANKEYADHKSATERLEKTHAYIDNLWDNILKGCYDKSKLDQDARMIQDEIFEHRTKSPLVLDKIYWMLRPRNENMMNNTAAIFINQINEAKADF